MSFFLRITNPFGLASVGETAEVKAPSPEIQKEIDACTAKLETQQALYKLHPTSETERRCLYYQIRIESLENKAQ